MSNTGSAITRARGSEAHDKVLENNPDRIGIWKCWFLRRGENWSTRRKTSRSKEENRQQIQYDAASGTRDTLVGGKRSHHCAIPGPLLYLPVCSVKDLQSVSSWLFSRGCSIWSTFGFLVTVFGFRRSVGLLVHGMTWYPWCLHVSLPRDIARYFGSS